MMLSGITFLSACIVILVKGNQKRSCIKYEDIHFAIRDYVSHYLGISSLPRQDVRSARVAATRLDTHGTHDTPSG